MKYKAVGSGEGLDMLGKDEADFAASDLLLPKDMKGPSEREWRMIPVFATAIGITFNAADFTFDSLFGGLHKHPKSFSLMSIRSGNQHHSQAHASQCRTMLHHFHHATLNPRPHISSRKVTVSWTHATRLIVPIKSMLNRTRRAFYNPR